MRLAQELGEKAYSLDIERAAALANATARASKAGELDAKAEAAAKAQQRAWDVPRAPHDGSPPLGPARLFNSVDRDPDIPDPRDDPMRAYFTLEPEAPDDLPEAPDPALPQPIAPGGRAERGGRNDSGAKWPPPSRWNDASAAKDGVGLEANLLD